VATELNSSPAQIPRNSSPAGVGTWLESLRYGRGDNAARGGPEHDGRRRTSRRGFAAL